MVDETGLEEPKVDGMAIDEMAADEPGLHQLSLALMSAGVKIFRLEFFRIRQINSSDPDMASRCSFTSTTDLSANDSINYIVTKTSQNTG